MHGSLLPPSFPASVPAGRPPRRVALMLVLLGSLQAPVHAQVKLPDLPDLLTVLDGDAVLIREQQRLEPAEGLRLRPEDILETGPGANLRVETGSRVILDLGPSTRLLLQPAMRRPGDRSRGSPPVAYLLQGWLKVSRQPDAFVANATVALPGLELSGIDGAAVVHAAPDVVTVFVEDGTARVEERRDPTRVARLPAGASIRLPAAGAATAWAAGGQRPASEFLRAVPKPFQDSLPPLAPRHERAPAPRPRALGPVRPADLEGWTKVSDPVLRERLAQRWRSRNTESVRETAPVPVTTPGAR